MAQYGLDNFVYEFDVNNGNAVFKFVDPDDASNHAEVEVNQKDFEGFAADSRQVADKAYAQVAQQLNDARDKRVEKSQADDLSQRQAEDKRAREAAQDFFDNTDEVQVAPAKVEKDGTTIFNTENVSEPTPTDTDTKAKK